MEVEQLLNTVMRVGTMLMSSGAEVYRVEDTMNRIAKSFQEVESVQSYVTATGIMLSINVEGKTRTHIARVRNRNVNVDTIDQ
ncbi:threonine/serine exporter family protein, partial [Dubosiella newyorkensis]